MSVVDGQCCLAGGFVTQLGQQIFCHTWEGLEFCFILKDTSYKLEVVAQPKWFNFMRRWLLYIEISITEVLCEESFERGNMIFIIVTDEFKANQFIDAYQHLFQQFVN